MKLGRINGILAVSFFVLLTGNATVGFLSFFVGNKIIDKLVGTVKD
jgi:hypothetical protein